jgi:hypothetical protein
VGAGGKENKIQAAITGALEVYCSGQGRPQLQLFPPYANQQGNGMRKYCADLVGMLGNAEIILLEIKELDCAKAVFPAFDQQQHDDNLRFEQLGVPIAYAYNKQEELAYYEQPRDAGWPLMTLGAVNRAVPSELPGRTPQTSRHSTLLDWLQNAQGADATELFGRVHGAIDAASDLRNGVLVLLYGVEKKTLAALEPQQVMTALDCLSEGWLKPAKEKKLRSILGASTAVFKDFTKPPIRRNPQKP